MKYRAVLVLFERACEIMTEKTEAFPVFKIDDHVLSFSSIGALVDVFASGNHGFASFLGSDSTGGDGLPAREVRKMDMAKVAIDAARAKAVRARAERLLAAMELLTEEQRESYANAIIGTAFANSLIETYRAKKSPAA